MKLADKTLELENDKFKIIEFDNERYEKNNRAHLYYKIQCKKCGEIFSRKKDCIHNFENLKCRNCIHNRFGKCLNALLYNVFTHYTNNAKQRNIDWNLSEEEFIDKVKSIYNNYIKSSTTISKESTLQANGSGNGELLTAS